MAPEAELPGVAAEGLGEGRLEGLARLEADEVSAAGFLKLPPPTEEAGVRGLGVAAAWELGPLSLPPLRTDSSDPSRETRGCGGVMPSADGRLFLVEAAAVDCM